nr:AlpA family phage regulatory protein [Pseudomonas putida]
MSVTELGRNTIYTRMREGTFPRQIRLGPHSVAWLQSDISGWMTSVVSSRSSQSEVEH